MSWEVVGGPIYSIQVRIEGDPGLKPEQRAPILVDGREPGVQVPGQSVSTNSNHPNTPNCLQRYPVT